MLSLLKRHQVQVLLAADHLAVEVARFAGVCVCERTVRRIGQEAGVIAIDDTAERQRRRIGRPSKVEEFREEIRALLQEEHPVAAWDSHPLEIAVFPRHTGRVGRWRGPGFA